MFTARFDGFSFGCRHRGQRRKTDRPLLCRVRRQSWSQQVRDRQVALVLLIDTYVSREKCTNQVFHHSVDASSTSLVVFVFFLGTKANFRFIEGYEDQHHAQTSRTVCPKSKRGRHFCCNKSNNVLIFFSGFCSYTVRRDV
jgi:hypothetical protein